MAITFHSDHALWQAFKAGSREALNSMFRTYYPVLYRYGYKISGDAHVVEENLQAFFLYLFEHRNGLTTPLSIKSYLFKAYRRRLLNQIEQSRLKKRRVAAMVDYQVNIQFSIEELMIRKEEEGHIQHVLIDMINALPRRQREVIYLRYYDSLSIKEVAEVLSITYQGTVNTIHKAMKALRMNESLERIATFL